MKAENQSREKPSEFKGKPTATRAEARKSQVQVNPFAHLFLGGAETNPMFTPRRKKLKGWQKELRRKGKINRYN